MPNANGRIVPNDKLGGGETTVVNVYANHIVSEQDTIDWILEGVRRVKRRTGDLRLS